MEDTASRRTACELAYRADKANFSAICLMRAAVVETIRAHNPEVGGSNPPPPPRQRQGERQRSPFTFLDDNPIVGCGLERGNILTYCEIGPAKANDVVK